MASYALQCHLGWRTQSRLADFFFTYSFYLGTPELSDGCHWVYAFLDQEMGKLVKSGNFNQFDILYLMKTEGNPLKGLFKLVRMVICVIT